MLVARGVAVVARVAAGCLVALLRRRQVAALAQVEGVQAVLVLVAAVAWVEVAAGLAATVVARSAMPVVAGAGAGLRSQVAALRVPRVVPAVVGIVAAQVVVAVLARGVAPAEAVPVPAA
jgi:hypothetical protein